MLQVLTDTNLGFPWKSPYWSGFFSDQHEMSYAQSDDLNLIRSEMASDEGVSFAYIPVALWYFMQKDSRYQVLASAVTASGDCYTNSVWIVRADSPINRTEGLRGSVYGRINAYCSSSYFAPAVLLSRHGHSIHGFFEKTVDVAVQPGNWQNQIDQVVSGQIDSTMVDERVWLANPLNAKTTKIIRKLEKIPTPIFTLLSSVPGQIAERFKRQLIDQNRSSDGGFCGFVRADSKLINGFLADSAIAFS